MVRFSSIGVWLRGLFLLLGLAWATALPAADEPKPEPEKTPAVLDKPAPENVEDLKALQAIVQRVVEKVTPCVVGVRIGPSQGSGVIINKEGHVLTAGHVSGPAGRECFLIFPDGKRVKGKTLGANRNIDSGLIQITEEGNWPCVEMGGSGELTHGQWCVAIGHPGGYRAGRTPVVRLGRVLFKNNSLVQTDCCLVGGDSGGPLFDLTGKVIGIHSRIGGPITANIHVPVDTYRDTFDRLAKGEVWGGFSARAGGPFLGVQGDLEGKDCRITQVVEGGPADKAGLKVNDIVKKLDGQNIANFEALVNLIQKKKPGDEVSLEVLRGEETVSLKVVVGKRM